MTTRKKSKLSVRKDTLFKKPSSSSSLYESRAKTLLKKAFELSELCGINVCIICYDREGNLVKTWPDNNDESQVKAMAERFSRLSAQERNKKSTNLSLFLNKKMVDEKKASLRANDNKFSKKVFVIEDSLETQLTILREKIQSSLLQSGQDHGVVSTDLGYASSVVNVDQYQPILTNQPSKFSILLYNHDNGTFTQLANTSALLPSFEQPLIPCNQDYGTNYLDELLGEQGMSSCNNLNLPISIILPPMMHTQTSMFQQFDDQFMQTQQGIPYNQMLSSDYPTMMFS
ncbi:unnamed protein product [Eruca vesicaria subsp. sativa]|uniref:MADS-box domain-containing protein n=1 Tax=Eruca vesicaria subsp. sativa TaxID=29727 RepID=A0ABC8L012_ERUVS|nr:unnamed protein product [Eruca vesicaria subsp. sativa]